LLGDSLGYAEVEAILNRLRSSPPIVQGRAQVLGYFEDGKVRFHATLQRPARQSAWHRMSCCASFFR
jgi:hypothetical protein